MSPPRRAVRARPAPRPGPGRPRKDEARAAADVALGRERILQAALALIDAQGLPAFSIRALAATLGVAPAAIYWHVPSRDALVSGAVALALEGVAAAVPAGAALPWQGRLRALLTAFRAALRAHPHLAPAVASELAYNAAFDAPLLEHVVIALEQARFEGEALVDAFNVVVAALCGFATLELSTAPADAGEAWAEACRARIDAVDAQRHPRLAGRLGALRNRAFLLRWTDGRAQPLQSGFEAWIDVLLRGLEARSRALRRA
ncbi:MAG: TetR family transcriptional regulator [Xenophilus sp.]